METRVSQKRASVKEINPNSQITNLKPRIYYKTYFK